MTAPAPAPRRVLVAGIGNIFLADDGFGPEVINALRARPLPDGVDAADFGIRGMDLVYRLLDGYAAAVLVDAAPRGGTPGTLYVLDVDGTGPDFAPAAPEAHGMDPVKVLATARELAGWEGAAFPRVVLVGCEPLVRMRGDEPDVVRGLSDPVRASLGEAARLVETVATDLLRGAAEPLPG
ncbi:hydrogenase maturation protease [Streptomyces sp. URMC 127]|uniref:hydrogenase maturation protease n=1 Tax=Streptomyces sp. URMC 127 TaxID=3423402 RepID=UPI003F1AAF2A